MVAVPRAGPTSGHHVAADLGVSGGQHGHREGGPAFAFDAVDQMLEMAFVAHHATHGQAGVPGLVGQSTSIGRVATASGHPHVDVNQHLTDSRGGRHIDRLGRIHGHRHPGSGDDQRTETARNLRIDDLVGQQQILAQISDGHALHLADRGAAEAHMVGGG